MDFQDGHGHVSAKVYTVFSVTFQYFQVLFRNKMRVTIELAFGNQHQWPDFTDFTAILSVFS
jgi:hypothetical protein